MRCRTACKAAKMRTITRDLLLPGFRVTVALYIPRESKRVQRDVTCKKQGGDASRRDARNGAFARALRMRRRERNNTLRIITPELRVITCRQTLWKGTSEIVHLKLRITYSHCFTKF